MLVNEIFQINLNYKDIELYLNLLLFLVASWVGYLSTIDFQNHYSFVFRILVTYFCFDLFLKPFHHIDQFIHHIMISVLLIVGLNSSVYFHTTITKVLLQTEFSSIILAPGSILKNYAKKNSRARSLSKIVNVLFAMVFIYYRILNLSYHLLFNPQVFDVLQEKRRQMSNDVYWGGACFLLYSFLGLNYFWLYKIISFFSKKKMIKNIFHFFESSNGSYIIFNSCLSLDSRLFSVEI